MGKKDEPIRTKSDGNNGNKPPQLSPRPEYGTTANLEGSRAGRTDEPIRIKSNGNNGNKPPQPSPRPDEEIRIKSDGSKPDPVKVLGSRGKTLTFNDDEE